MDGKQIVRVNTGQVDGDEAGNEWVVHYALYQAKEEDTGLDCFELWRDDNAGNGVLICSGYNQRDMCSITMKLGEFFEWAPGVGRVAA